MVSSGVFWGIILLSFVIGIILGIWWWMYSQKKDYEKSIAILKEMNGKEVEDGETREGEDDGEDESDEGIADVGGREEEAGGPGNMEIEPFDPTAGDQPLTAEDVRPNSQDFA